MDVRRRAVSPNARSAYLALAIGLALAVSYIPLADTRAWPVVYLGTAGFGTVLSVVGALRMPRAQRRIWWAFAFGQASFWFGDAVWAAYETAGGGLPNPSVADVGYLACYPALALGMLWMIRGRWRGQDRAAFLDAMILTTGLTVVGGVLLVGPAAAGGGASLLAQAVAGSYPAFDLLLLALAVRMITGGLVRSAAMWGLLTGCALLLLADLYWVGGVLTGVPYPDWVDATYLASYVLYGFAALHPSAPGISEPAAGPARQPGVGRVAWLGVAMVLAPVTGQLAHQLGHESGEWVALIGGFVVAGLVVARVTDLVHDLQAKAVQLAALARRDGLTGIPNRRTWEHELSRACALARDGQTALTVAILDFDRFKAYNDEHGHLAGDRVLKATAAAWTSTLPEQGFIARFGGEEFAALLPGMAGAEAVRVLDRLRSSVTHGQTCSIGMATWDGEEDPAQMVARADQALYHAKHEGRNRVAVHDGTAVAVATVAEQDPVLDSIRAVYQPIVDLHSDEPVAYEALSRFDGANPQEVFERALREGTGPVVEARAVRAALTSWEGGGRLALNLSPVALVSSEVQAVLPWDLSGVIVEVTETDLADCTAAVMVTLENLRGRGALIAIDDFGTGFSNVHRIAVLRPDLIKLDMSLVRGVDRDQRLHGAITATLVLAQHTGSRVIAEGIETQPERECLVGLGVQLGQGYLLGRPAPASVLAEAL